ncbi:glycosyltransferase family 4 protein [Candidatus Daviesbacteria bacterium]|nr:glycosyltransferase family 4 protein [Candidatus Daviesbacteria bacterium]
MRIGFDGSRSFASWRTGTENYSYYLLKNLAKIDIENDYFVYLRPSTKIRSEEWPKNFTFKAINFLYLWTQVGLGIETFKDNLDLLFIPAHTLPIVRNPRLKTVLTVHDLGSEYLPGYHQLKQILYLKFITKIQLKTAIKIIAVSNATKKDLVEKVGIKEEKIKVIYEGVDREVFKAVKGKMLVNSLRQYNLVSKNFFLFVGTIQPRKNLERLIKAFSDVILRARAPFSEEGSQVRKNSLIDSSPSVQNDSIKLVLVGDKGWKSDEIYELPKKLGIEGKVKFLGRVEDRDLPALYSGALGLVYPSLFEGFGLPILEAFSCGCPVLTSNISSLPEVAGEAAILVDPYNIDAIRDGMIKLTDNNFRDKLTKKGYLQLNKFSWQIAAKETLKLFKEVNSGAS